MTEPVPLGMFDLVLLGMMPPVPLGMLEPDPLGKIPPVPLGIREPVPDGMTLLLEALGVEVMESLEAAVPQEL